MYDTLNFNPYGVCAFIFNLLLAIVYFSKKRVKNEETDIYNYLVASSFFGCVISFFTFYITKYYDSVNSILLIIPKFFLLYLIVWGSAFTLYIAYISLYLNTKVLKIVQKTIYGLSTIAGLLIFILPMEYVSNGNIIYTRGSCVYLTYGLTALYSLMMLIVLLINHNNINRKKLIPVFVFILLGTIIIYIQFRHPQLLIIPLLLTFITMLMYFTIENPDLKVLEEVNKNRQIIENTNQDMANYLFKISKDLREPVEFIINDTKNKNSETAKRYYAIGKHLEYLIEEGLDFSGISSKDIQIVNNNYNVPNMFNALRLYTEKKINDKVSLEYNLSKNLPNYVYGDGVRIKQLLTGVIDNAIKHTKNGMIDIDVYTITKYDVCRFIIDIKSTDGGITIDKVNEIISLDKRDDINELESNTDKLSLLKLLANKIGSSFLVRSEKKSTIVSIAYDQKIVKSETDIINEQVVLYEEQITGKRNILIADSNLEELNSICRYLNKKDLICHGTLFGQDVIDKVSTGYDYDYIILNDDLDDLSALDTLNQLRNVVGFNIPVVVMLEENKLSIKQKYLDSGFTNVINKEKLTKELCRTLKLSK